MHKEIKHRLNSGNACYYALLCINKKNFKISILSKMAKMILIKFCGFIVHLKHNNMTLSTFSRKIPEIIKKKIILCVTVSQHSA